MANVSIPAELFTDLCKYFIFEQDDATTANRIYTALNAKLDAMRRRDAYTRSKTALTQEDRESARQEYAELANIPQDFRY